MGERMVRVGTLEEELEVAQKTIFDIMDPFDSIDFDQEDSIVLKEFVKAYQKANRVFWGWAIPRVTGKDLVEYMTQAIVETVS